MRSECPWTDWRGKSYPLDPRESGPDVSWGPYYGQVASFRIRPCSVPSLCGARRTVTNCWKPCGISNLPPRDAALVNLPREKAGMKTNDWVNEWKMNLHSFSLWKALCICVSVYCTILSKSSLAAAEDQNFNTRNVSIPFFRQNCVVTMKLA